MQKAKEEQTRKDAEQKLSEKKQEIDNMRHKVSLMFGSLKSMLTLECR